ncbi:olfactory receptor 478-like [Tachyglossus aculeatus]|uniref:olfactory receptor 478-like n=1 Tax=Tachyglossus aculeatus TaxID=9261 RepID=UPI0018F5B771|nr:olfactory receptor 478-like [Tachyglossus aculeatus]
MADGNFTFVSEFFLLGLTDDPVLRVIFFLIFLMVYSVTIMGNLCIIMLIRVSSQLHTPMYLFLSHLAFIDIWYSSSVTPKMLKGFLVGRDTISYAGCAAQMCFTFAFGTSEAILLAMMAYDRYVAICNPLLYVISMSNRVCVQLLIVSYVGGCLNALVFTTFVFNLVFCETDEIDHFFCDFPPLMEISCSDIHLIQILSSISVAIIILSTVLTIIISYVYILCAIMRIQTSEGRQKAFSTCTSHLTALILFYGTITFTYVWSSSSRSSEQNKGMSLFYTVVIPTLNPIIYTLRNKDVKGALMKIMGKNVSSW